MGLFGFLFGKKKKAANEEKNDLQKQYLKQEKSIPERIKEMQSGTYTGKSANAMNDESPIMKSYSTKVMPKSKEAVPTAGATVVSAPANKPQKSKTSVKDTTPIGDDLDVKTTQIMTPEKSDPEVKIADSKPVSTAVIEEKVEDEAPETADNVAVTEGAPTRSGKFDIMRAKDGRYFFNLYASNYVVIAYSQLYSSTQSAMTGIKSVIANANKAAIEDTTLKKPVAMPFPKWEIYIDKAGEYRFRLYASNGNCICHSSHGYASKSSCKGGIDSISRFASENAGIDKKYLNK